ncbi:unnamed protein product [Sphagnum troendelagicum]|uniref:40S ribosomal protein S17 n=1 Tax=Sphagnum troendelagicum TaxID=128251 RepID=A0ABP0TFP6_9BRYO
MVCVPSSCWLAEIFVVLFRNTLEICASNRLVSEFVRFGLRLPVVCFLSPLSRRGRVRTKTVKKASRVIIERYYSRMTLDFQTNKKIAEEVAIIPSKRLRNKIAGFATHLMKRIQRGPVRGISLKLQEEERERRMDFVPEESAIKTDVIEVDRETIELLAALNMPQLPGVVQQAAPPAGGGFFKPQVGGFQGNKTRT